MPSPQTPLTYARTALYAVAILVCGFSAIICVNNGVGLQQKVGGALICLMIGGGFGYFIWRDWFKKSA